MAEKAASSTSCQGNLMSSRAPPHTTLAASRGYRRDLPDEMAVSEAGSGAEENTILRLRTKLACRARRQVHDREPARVPVESIMRANGAIAIRF